MADTKVTALTNLSVPAMEDEIYIVDDPSGTPLSRQASLAQVHGMADPGLTQGRLTTETTVAISTSDRTSQGTIYFTPYNGSTIAIYDGTRWKGYSFTERSLALAGLTSGKNYDVFIYDNAGTLTLELSAAWSSDTARTDAIVRQDGVWCKSGALTRKLVGTIRATGATATEDSAANRLVWNSYNRRPRRLQSANETTDSWTYATATWRQANANTANQLNFVMGLSEDQVEATLMVMARTSTTGIGADNGIGLDSTTTPTGLMSEIAGPTAAAGVSTATVPYRGTPSIGYHFLAWLEYSTGATSTWFGDAGLPTAFQSGISGTIWN